MVKTKTQKQAIKSIIHSNLDGDNYIDGEFLSYRRGVEGSDMVTEVYTNINPATGDGLGEYPQSTAVEVADAVLAARDAFKTWKKVSRVRRAEYFNELAKVIEERRDELATAISLDTGKTYNESIAEVNEALHMAQFAFGSGRVPCGEAVASELAEKDSYMIRKPKGVIAIISPFNFPLAIGGFWCAAPAIVEGNTVVLKPSEDAPLTAHLTAKLYDQAGLPPGVFNVIHGNGMVGQTLVYNDDIDHICFTGSAEVGMSIRRIAAESWHKTTSCEMGRKSSVIVFDDANYDLALAATLASAFKLSGQRCVSSGRILIQRGIYDKFCEDFTNLASQLETGAPFKTVVHSTGMPEAVAWDSVEVNDEPYYGPLINRQAYDKVRRYNDMVLDDEAATVTLEPTYKDRNRAYFSTPMVYKTEWRDVPYLKEEVFGPHVALVPFDTLEDAVRIYNDTEYGLAVGVCTEDYKKARVMRDELDYGMCYWNGGSIAAESHLAFGGVKKSGNGYPSAARTFRAVTNEVSWTINHGEELAFPQGMTK
jgi:aldehyde dehydrogenase (NAD+)